MFLVRSIVASVTFQDVNKASYEYYFRITPIILLLFVIYIPLFLSLFFYNFGMLFWLKLYNLKLIVLLCRLWNAGLTPEVVRVLGGAFVQSNLTHLYLDWNPFTSELDASCLASLCTPGR